MTKHSKLRRPTDVDLHRNPMMGATKGMTMPKPRETDLADNEGENPQIEKTKNTTNPRGANERPDKPTAKQKHTHQKKKKKPGAQAPNRKTPRLNPSPPS